MFWQHISKAIEYAYPLIPTIPLLRFILTDEIKDVHKDLAKFCSLHNLYTENWNNWNI